MPPKLYDVEWEYWEAFGELHTDRQQGGHIPWSSIREYAKHKSGTDAEVLFEIIRRMDDAYLKHQSGSSKSFSREMMRK